METSGFGRLVSHDARDRSFQMASLLPPPTELQLPQMKTWAIRAVNLDQGRTGTCVGHAWRNFLRSEPLQSEHTQSAYDIYRKAITLDEWKENDNEVNLPDGDPRLEHGTSVRAGAEAVKSFGRLQSYVWAWDLQTVIEWVLLRGPVVMGTNWYNTFMDTDGKGFITLSDRSRVVGGHAWLLRGVDTTRGRATACNSWGDGWGVSGNFFIALRDLERLIREDGEACAAVEQKVAKS